MGWEGGARPRPRRAARPGACEPRSASCRVGCARSRRLATVFSASMNEPPASPLSEDDPSLPSDVASLVRLARTRWLKNPEIYQILDTLWERTDLLQTTAAQKPASASCGIRGELDPSRPAVVPRRAAPLVALPRLALLAGSAPSPRAPSRARGAAPQVALASRGRAAAAIDDASSTRHVVRGGAGARRAPRGSLAAPRLPERWRPRWGLGACRAGEDALSSRARSGRPLGLGGTVAESRRTRKTRVEVKEFPPAPLRQPSLTLLLSASPPLLLLRSTSPPSRPLPLPLFLRPSAPPLPPSATSPRPALLPVRGSFAARPHLPSPPGSFRSAPPQAVCCF